MTTIVIVTLLTMAAIMWAISYVAVSFKAFALCNVLRAGAMIFGLATVVITIIK